MAALTVSNQEQDLAFLRGVFEATRWTLHVASSVKEGLLLIKRRLVDVVVIDRDVPDGGWRRMLEALRSLSAPPPLIVTSRLAEDTLWAEVLNEGGYDVLAQPLDREEVLRVLSAACRQNRNVRYHQARRKPLVASAAS
jgi:DNA-binding response OmpR family regulator